MLSVSSYQEEEEQDDPDTRIASRKKMTAKKPKLGKQSKNCY